MLADLRNRTESAIGERIGAVLAECQEDGWSGERDSVAIQKSAAEHAKRFIAMVDVSRFPLPEVVPEPDGDLALEWHRDGCRWLIVSFQADGRVNYACRAGEGDKATGTSRITPEFIRIMEGHLAIVHSE